MRVNEVAVDFREGAHTSQDRPASFFLTGLPSNRGEQKVLKPAAGDIQPCPGHYF
jgi:hypothetical protein